MSLEDELYELERTLATGNGGTYRELLTDDALITVPGQTLNKEQAAQAMDASQGWDAISFDAEQFTQLGDDTALLTYRFRGQRGVEFSYNALMGSVYVRREAAWRMAFHQQTPLS